MRFKKQKRHRRTVKFFKTCFGFRPPYKVVCDGTFILHLLVHQLLPADEVVSNLLADPVKLFTTNCVLTELKRLAKKHGKSHSDALQAALKLVTARCEHDQNTSADDCIKDIVDNNNPERFYVATQDADLRTKLQQIPGVPLIFGLRNALFLEQPSKVQHTFVKGLEEERLHMSQAEHKLLQKRTREILGTEETEVTLDENEDYEKPEMSAPTPIVHKKQAAGGLGVNDKPQFKRKKAKGPNPLSCKPKKKTENPASVSRKENNESSDAAAKRKRKRKKPRGERKTATTDD
ncbi:hypothetical protein ACFE04_024173 [Oxalis oulophora]